MSFSFAALEDDWSETPDGKLLRTVKKMRVFEVSIVATPAYPSTTVSL